MLTFKDKQELIQFTKTNNNRANDIVNHLYYLKRMGRLYEYMFDDNEISYLEELYGITLSDYRKNEMNVDIQLNKIKESNNKIEFINIIKYINKRKSLDFNDEFNQELFNELLEHFNLK